MTTVRALEKRVARDRKVMQKKMKGRAKRVVDPNKPPSGFAVPGLVSDEPVLSRSDLTNSLLALKVTKITEYRKAHNLQSNGRQAHH